MLKAKKAFIALLLGIVMLFGVAGCNKKSQESTGTFYTLQEAYENGWLTQENLKNIAYYHNNGIPYPESLSNNIAKSIKKSWAKKLKDDNTNQATDITEEMVVIEEYYGTYDECVIIIVDRFDANYPGIYAPYTIEIGNVIFNYNLYRPVIIVFKF